MIGWEAGFSERQPASRPRLARRSTAVAFKPRNLIRYFAAVFSFSLSFSVCVFIIRIQSPSDGVGNWQVLVVTTATAGLFSPVRGLTQVTFGEGGKESSLISMVRSSGT